MDADSDGISSDGNDSDGIADVVDVGDGGDDDNDDDDNAATTSFKSTVMLPSS